ncbi:MAG: hypothetical protein NTZ78_13090 [Candidatus Aureabacteria bacterium]|nr:hypothetical protein [Candidatus Auribacterota bacterium]
MKWIRFSGIITLAISGVLFSEFPAPLSAGLAYGTKVAMVGSNGWEFRPVEQTGLDDNVYAVVQGIQGPEWKARAIKYSYGTGPGIAQSSAIRISFGSGKSGGSITVTDDNIFLLSDSLHGGYILKRALSLIPGADKLVNSQGQEIPIRSITFTNFKGGFHQIATGADLNDKVDNSWEGHLILTNGIVSGDYLLQAAYSR